MTRQPIPKSIRFEVLKRDAFRCQYCGAEDGCVAAFSKIVGICRVHRASLEDPDIQQLYYIRGILRKRIAGYFEPHKALHTLKVARSWGVPMNDLSDIAKHVTHWAHFNAAVRDAIEDRKSLASGERDE